MPMSKLGELILESRKIKGLSHEKLGELVIYDRSNILNIEAGNKEASNDLLKRMANVFEIPYERLLALKLIDRMNPDVRKWVLIELQKAKTLDEQHESSDL